MVANRSLLRNKSVCARCSSCPAKNSSALLNHSCGSARTKARWQHSSRHRRASPPTLAPIFRPARSVPTGRVISFRVAMRDGVTTAAQSRTMRRWGNNVVRGETVLETEDLTKEFAGFVAVRSVNLRIARGSIHAIIGPNGAGKTTFFNLLSKFLNPTRGRIVFDGRESPRSSLPMSLASGWCARFRSRRYFHTSRCWRTCGSRCSAGAAVRSISGARSACCMRSTIVRWR